MTDVTGDPRISILSPSIDFIYFLYSKSLAIKKDFLVFIYCYYLFPTMVMLQSQAEDCKQKTVLGKSPDRKDQLEGLIDLS